MGVVELLGFKPRSRSAGAAQKKRARRSMRVSEMDKELVIALAAANTDHLDPELNNLLD